MRERTLPDFFELAFYFFCLINHNNNKISNSAAAKNESYSQISEEINSFSHNFGIHLKID